MKRQGPRVLQVGERLGRFEVEKRCAVEREDYDLAKEKKLQMERFRSRVYEQLQRHSLVDAEPVGARPRPTDPCVLQGCRGAHIAPSRAGHCSDGQRQLRHPCRRRCWAHARRQTRGRGVRGQARDLASPPRLALLVCKMT